MKERFVRFEELRLCDYGPFQGSHCFKFDCGRTLIVGDFSSGKTIIVNALANLGPAPGVKPNVHGAGNEMEVSVITSGDRGMINTYGCIIFLRGDSAQAPGRNQGAALEEMRNEKHEATIKEEMAKIFECISGREFDGTLAQSGRKPSVIRAGDTALLEFAFSIAVRKALNLELPIVWNSPYGRMGGIQREGVRAFLSQLDVQQILVGSQTEFLEEDEPTYQLVRTGT